MLPIEYTARDSSASRYLTLPVGRPCATPKPLPVVVVPTSPWARDSWAGPEARFWPTRGYAVLQMNFRGSTGFGRRFLEIAFGK